MMKRSFQQSILIKIILLALAIGLFFPFRNFSVLAESNEEFYIIKLKPGVDEKILSITGKSLKKRFEFSKNEIFNNIYTFKSTYDRAILTSILYGKYEYLNFNNTNILKQQAVSVNDPGFASNPLDIDKQWGLLKAKFPEVWAISTGSKNNIVAVVDTGVDATHEDLQNINFVQGYNFISKQYISGKTNSDDNGHGTLVAGILGATANNTIGIAGTNWQISVMPLKALDETGKGEATAISEAIVWAADNGAHIINLSIGGVGFEHDAVLANAISYAFNKNILIVAAAGNDSATTGTSLDIKPVFPICDDNNKNMVLGVAAIDQNDLKPAFSNFGKSCIDVVAPGKRILSTINFDPITKKSVPNSYAYASGTSLAVPFVAGQAAILKSIFPFFTNTQLRDTIILSAISVDDLNMSQCGGISCRGFLGAGRINLVKSIEGSVSFDGVKENELVKIQDSNQIYQINGGRKRPISTFVLNRRFQGTPIKTISAEQLAGFSEGSYVTPLDGTLVKIDKDPTVFMVQAGQKFPLTYQVFKQRGLSFDAVNTVSFPEFSSWVTSYFLPPAEGTIIRNLSGKSIYWVVGQALHPISSTFFKEKGLQIFPVLRVSDRDIEKFPKGEAYSK